MQSTRRAPPPPPRFPTILRNLFCALQERSCSAPLSENFVSRGLGIKTLQSPLRLGQMADLLCRVQKKRILCQIQIRIGYSGCSVSGRSRIMRKRSMASVIVLVAAMTFSAPAFAQNARPQRPGSSKVQKATAAPAPFHDISGTWEPANGPGDGIQPYGAKAMPNDGKPEHQLPYTPYGLEAYKSHKALIGIDEVLPSDY